MAALYAVYAFWRNVRPNNQLALLRFCGLPPGREKFSDWDPLFLQLDSARDAADLMAGVTRAVASGHVSPGEAACGSRECDRWAF